MLGSSSVENRGGASAYPTFIVNACARRLGPDGTHWRRQVSSDAITCGEGGAGSNSEGRRASGGQGGRMGGGPAASDCGSSKLFGQVPQQGR